MIILQVVIGLVFVLLLLSLFATTLMELIASGLSLRGKNLEKALRNMLGISGQTEKIYDDFKGNALYRQLSQKFWGKHYSPSYLSSSSFRSILFNVILNGKGEKDLQQCINELEDPDLQKVLNQFLQDANGDLDKFKERIEGWYNDVMDRASGWYKRYTQKILVFVGVAIAVVFNADTIAIYQRLESDPETLQKIVDIAESYANANEEFNPDAPLMPISDSTVVDTVIQYDPTTQEVDSSLVAFDQSLAEVRSYLQNEINAVKAPLGMGWENFDYVNADWVEWLYKVLGWTITSLAISLGAPFWFDLLKKIVNIRAAGNEV